MGQNNSDSTNEVNGSDNCTKEKLSVGNDSHHSHLKDQSKRQHAKDDLTTAVFVSSTQSLRQEKCFASETLVDVRESDKISSNENISDLCVQNRPV